MTVQTSDNGKIVKSSTKPGDSLVKMLDQMKGEIARAVPRHVSADRMARIVTTAIRTVPKLAHSDAVSFIGSVLALAQLGLEPCTPLGLAWLIPRENKKTGKIETTIMLGYQGYLQLARQSGLVTGVFAYPVFEGDHFRWSLGTEPKIEHEPVALERTDPGQVTHAYAVARVRDADPLFEVLTMEQIEVRKKRSMARNNGPWVTDTIAMQRKTAIRALWPFMPKSAEMADAEAMDDASDRGKSIASAVPQNSVAAEVLDRLGAPREEIIDVDPSTGEVRAEDEPPEPGSNG